MLFLLALLFFSVSTSVTALPMIQYYNHDTGPTISLPTVNQQPGPDAMASPIGNALPALEELDLPEEELIPRFAGCWTLMEKNDPPFAFCTSNNPETRHYPTIFGNPGSFPNYQDSRRYKRVMNEAQLTDILQRSHRKHRNREKRLQMCRPLFKVVERGWESDISYAKMTCRTRMKMEQIFVPKNDTRNWGCWTPMVTEGHGVAPVVCVDRDYQVYEYPVGHTWNEMTFMRVSTPDYFTDQFLNVEHDRKMDQAVIKKVQIGHGDPEYMIRILTVPKVVLSNG